MLMLDICPQYSNIFSMLSSVLWPSDTPRDDTDYDFVYPMHLNMSEKGQFCLNLHSDDS